MKIKEDQFDAIAYIFELNNGNVLDDYEYKVIDKSGFKDIPADVLTDAILDNLNDDHSMDTTYRILAYWALSKRFDTNLLPFFRDKLKLELSIDGIPAVFQLLIALDNLDQPVFGDDRDGSFSADDTELNIRDAKAYLENRG